MSATLQFIIKSRTYFLSLALTIACVVAVPLHFATFGEAFGAVMGIGLVNVAHQENHQHICDAQSDADAGKDPQ